MEKFNKKTDYCTMFPEVWLGVDIRECCYIHDEVKVCSTKQFYKCLKEKFKKSDKRLVSKLYWFHASYIALGGGIGCWLKYTSKMIKRV